MIWLKTKKLTKDPEEDNFISKYIYVITAILVITLVFGMATHSTEFISIWLLFTVWLILTQNENIKELKYKISFKDEDITFYKQKVKTLEEDINIFYGKGESILDEYDPKQIESAEESLVKNGLTDDYIQAQRNLEMDLEERQQLATGGGKKRKN